MYLTQIYTREAVVKKKRWLKNKIKERNRKIRWCQHVFYGNQSFFSHSEDGLLQLMCNIRESTFDFERWYCKIKIVIIGSVYGFSWATSSYSYTHFSLAQGHKYVELKSWHSSKNQLIPFDKYCILASQNTKIFQEVINLRYSLKIEFTWSTNLVSK